MTSPLSYPRKESLIFWKFALYCAYDESLLPGPLKNKIALPESGRAI
jgi:hypothetical protein